LGHATIETINGDATRPQQLDATSIAVLVAENHASDLSLLYELGTLEAWGVRGVQSRALCANPAILGDLHQRIRFGVQNFWLGAKARWGRVTLVVLARIVLVSSWHAIVAVGDDLLVLDDEGADLKAIGLGTLGPNLGHLHVSFVELDAVRVDCDCDWFHTRIVTKPGRFGVLDLGTRRQGNSSSFTSGSGRNSSFGAKQPLHQAICRGEAFDGRGSPLA
jgi:hypothetical protein